MLVVRCYIICSVHVMGRTNLELNLLRRGQLWHKYVSEYNFHFFCRWHISRITPWGTIETVSVQETMYASPVHKYNTTGSLMIPQDQFSDRVFSEISSRKTSENKDDFVIVLCDSIVTGSVSYSQAKTIKRVRWSSMTIFINHFSVSNCLVCVVKLPTSLLHFITSNQNRIWLINA